MRVGRRVRRIEKKEGGNAPPSCQIIQWWSVLHALAGLVALTALLATLAAALLAAAVLSTLAAAMLSALATAMLFTLAAAMLSTLLAATLLAATLLAAALLAATLLAATLLAALAELLVLVLVLVVLRALVLPALILLIHSWSPCKPERERHSAVPVPQMGPKLGGEAQNPSTRFVHTSKCD